MERVPIINFGGLQTSLANPALGSAKSLQNFVRHRHRGWLEQMDGYAKKYDLPTAKAKQSNLAFVDFHNFYVPDHGGQNITVVVGTYRLTSQYDPAVFLDRSGVWVRPYWSGAAWTDAWQELTDTEIFKVDSLLAPSTILFTTNWPDQNHFRNYVAVFEDYSQAQDHDNYLLITSSGTQPAGITFFGTTANLARAANAKCILTRAFLNSEMPSAVTSWIFSLLNEIRLTTGNSATDLSLLAGFRTKTFGWATSDKSRDGLILDIGALNVWRYAFFHSLPTQIPDADPVPAATYTLKETLVMDDNSETELRDSSAHFNTNTFTKGLGQQLPGAVGGQAVTTDGTYLYVLDAAGNVTKYDGTTLQPIGAAFTPAGPASAGRNVLIVENGFLYIAEGNQIEKVDASTMTSVTIYAPAFGPANEIISFASDGTYLYVGVDKHTELTNFIYRVPLATFNSFVTLDVDAVGFATQALFYNQTTAEVYAGVAPGAVYIPVASFTLGGTLAPGGTIEQFCACSDATLILAALGTSPGKVISINTVSRAVVVVQTFAAGENIAAGIAYDGTNVWVGLSVNPYVVKKLSGNGSAILYSVTGDVGETLLAGLVIALGIPFVLTVTATARLIYFNTHANESIVCPGTTMIQFTDLVSAGALPARGKAIRHYLSTNGATFNLVKEVSLYDLAIGWSAAAYYDAAVEHFYHQSATISITGSDIAAIGAEASVQIGRAVTDTGIIPHKVGTVIGKKAWIGNATIAGIAVPNKGFVCATSGDGTIQYDVFPNDGAHVVDMEYSDGDYIVAIAPVIESPLFLKHQSVVLVVPNNQGGYDRQLVSRKVGCCSAKTVCVVDDTVYWMDYNGAQGFSMRGMRLLNPQWVEDWKALSTAQKEAAVAAVDRVNKILIVSAAGQQWLFDLNEPRQEDPRGQEWMVDVLTDVPTMMKEDIPGTVDFVSGTKIQTISPASTQHDGANYTMRWESNKVEVLKGAEGYAFDALLEEIAMEFESDVDISMDLYLDDSAVPVNPIPYVLSRNFKKQTVLAPLSCTCKAFRMKLSATTTAAGQEVKIKSGMMYYDKMPVGGDVMVSQ